MESTLNLKLADFETKVGVFLGYGPGDDRGGLAWTRNQQAVIDDCMESGVRQFYFPTVLGPEGSYSWSFLKPAATVTLESSGSTVRMPDDFGGLEGPVSFSSGSQSNVWSSLSPTGEGRLVEAYGRTPTQTGAPLMLSVRALKGTALDRSNRYEMFVFPLADMEYTFSFSYSILADALSSANPFAYGGAYHSETLLESCLCIAEERYNNLPNGVHKSKFVERLRASISDDRRLKPQQLGYNGDGTWRRGRYFRQPPTVNFHPEA